MAARRQAAPMLGACALSRRSVKKRVRDRRAQKLSRRRGHESSESQPNLARLCCISRGCAAVEEGNSMFKLGLARAPHVSGRMAFSDLLSLFEDKSREERQREQVEKAVESLVETSWYHPHTLLRTWPAMESEEGQKRALFMLLCTIALLYIRGVVSVSPHPPPRLAAASHQLSRCCSGRHTPTVL